MKSHKHELVGKVLLPGDRVFGSLPGNKKLKFGTGLRTKSGKLSLKTSQKKYVPVVDETVVGIVQDRNAEVFLVEIFGSSFAELPVTAFENATKRNVPPLKCGDLIYSRLTSAFAFTNPTLSCVDSNGKAAGMGVLKQGCTARVSTAFARSLLSKPMHPVLALLGDSIQFTAVVGMNGLVWISTGNPLHAIFIGNTLRQCNGLDRDSAESQVQQSIKNLNRRRDFHL